MTCFKFLSGFLAGTTLFMVCNAASPTKPTDTTEFPAVNSVRAPIRWNTIPSCDDTPMLILYNSRVITILNRPGDIDTVDIPAGDSVLIKYRYPCSAKNYKTRSIVIQDTATIFIN